MRRHNLLTLSIALMWIGAILSCACWLTRWWFQTMIPITPICMMMLGAGIVLYMIVRRLN